MFTRSFHICYLIGSLSLSKQNKNDDVGIFPILLVKRLRFSGGSWLELIGLLIHSASQLLFFPSSGCICTIHRAEHSCSKWGDAPKCWHPIQMIINIFQSKRHCQFTFSWESRLSVFIWHPEGPSMATDSGCCEEWIFPLILWTMFFCKFLFFFLDFSFHIFYPPTLYHSLPMFLFPPLV